MVPSLAATAAIGVGLAQGALAASFAISGQEFKVKAASLEGDNFVQYGSVAEGNTLEGKPFKAPVAVSGFSEAWITNMCQSVVTPGVFGLPDITLQLTAGTEGAGKKDKQVYAKNLYLDVSSLKADAEFTNIDIGVAAGDLGKKSGFGAQPGTTYNPNGFGQRAEHAKLTGVKQTAWATTAGTFRLPDLDLSLKVGKQECF
ncbi:cholesterol esterase [Streptomyces laurentii]|uniref:Cholesterol esterase n=2 Tax=Streptomyces laurentii TaxID=39478 RepID=A0A160P5M1_STRLU|nr:cholesterol esterase [Streptomyces laurentii]